MTFAELLAVKDEACHHKEETVAALLDAESAAQAATKADCEATEAKRAAHKAIHDLLCDMGERCTVADDGEVTIYRAVEPSDEDDPGWRSYHPITEATLKAESPKPKVKAK